MTDPTKPTITVSPDPAPLTPEDHAVAVAVVERIAEDKRKRRVRTPMNLAMLALLASLPPTD